jgi:hypothetical protein
MSKKRISFHLSESNSTLLLSTFHWLVCKNVYRSSCSGLRFVRDHVSKSLIIDTSHVYIDFHLISKYSGHHCFITIVVIAVLHKFFSEEIDSIVVLVFFKSFCVYEFSIQTSTFTSEGFDKHTNCHSGWESVRIDNDIWSYTIFSEWHVFLWPDDTHYTLLSMSR